MIENRQSFLCRLLLSRYFMKEEKNHMKKFLALLLSLVMALSLVACGGGSDAPADDGAGEESAEDLKSNLKVGFIFLHDENSTYDMNFLDAAKATCKAMGLSDDQVVLQTNIPEGQECYDVAAELADAGCSMWSLLTASVMRTS